MAIVDTYQSGVRGLEPRSVVRVGTGAGGGGMPDGHALRSIECGLLLTLLSQKPIVVA